LPVVASLSLSVFLSHLRGFLVSRSLCCAQQRRRASTNLYDDETPTGTRTVKGRQGRRASIQGRKGDNSILGDDGETSTSDEREQINRHILAVFDTCAAMNASQLRFVFDALDVDPKNGD
jgi:hypothetical protein